MLVIVLPGIKSRIASIKNLLHNEQPCAVSLLLRGDGAPEYGAWAVVVGMPDGRALRRLCREHGPWRTVPLRFTEPGEVVQAFRATDVAVVVDGGRREGPPPTVVDATLTPIRVLREGALPASFIEGTMLMSTRRKLFSRTKRPPAG